MALPVTVSLGNVPTPRNSTHISTFTMRFNMNTQRVPSLETFLADRTLMWLAVHVPEADVV